MATLRTLAAVFLLLKAVSPQISSNGSMSAVFGEDVHYWCAMDDQTTVRQVTWQRLFPDNSMENLATFSPRFGQQVNEPFEGKVVITAASLGAMSITVRDVTWADESCYVCSFNTFPGGSKSQQTCLTVSGISKVTTSHEIAVGDRKDGRREVFLSCSATGKPVPTVQWEVAPSEGTVTNQEQPTQVKHDDRTVTTSSLAVLSAPGGWEGHVDCVVNGGKKRQRTPLSLQDEDTPTGRSTSHLGTVLGITSMLIGVSAAGALVFKRSKRRRETSKEVA